MRGRGHGRRPPPRNLIWTALVGYVLVASGLPLPMGAVGTPDARSPAAKRLAGKDRSRPFPCMDKPCGCATAEQCFTSCCCHTPAQTLAWARAHRVAPAVLASLERRVASGRRSVAKAASPSCCSPKASVEEESCCRTKPSAKAAVGGDDACCSSQSLAAKPAASAAKPAEHSPSDREPDAEPRPRTMTLRAMLACGGIVADWFVAGAALPPPKVELALSLRLLEGCTFADETCESPACSLATPPPRAA